MFDGCFFLKIEDSINIKYFLWMKTVLAVLAFLSILTLAAKAAGTGGQLRLTQLQQLQNCLPIARSRRNFQLLLKKGIGQLRLVIFP